MTASETTLYPISIHFLPDTNCPKLRDVDGFYLLEEPTGRYLNIYNPAMAEAFACGTLRAIHNVRDGYLYFITHEEQMHRFMHEREHGSELENRKYYVYLDPQ